MKSTLASFLVLLVVQLLLAGSNAFVTLAGMQPEIIVSYRSVFGSATFPALAGFTFLIAQIFPAGFRRRFDRLLERELYWPINLQWKDLIILVISSFAAALFGLSIPQVLSVKSMSYMDPSFASAMANFNPVIVTFITLPIAFREEIKALPFLVNREEIKAIAIPAARKLKLIVVIIIGWVLWAVAVIGGVWYQGHVLLRTPHLRGATPTPNYAHGVSMSVAAAVSTAFSVLLQATMFKKYRCFFLNMGLMTLMEAIQVTAYAVFIDHSPESWKLGFNFRLWAVLYLGIGCSGILVGVMAFCMQFIGPQLVSVFNPFMLLMSTFGAPFTSDGKFRIHSVISGLPMLLALSVITWAHMMMQEESTSPNANDLELGNL